jgi:hypothetical protein
MTTAVECFLHLPEYQVAVCRTCHYSVHPDNAPTHLREKHRGLTKEERARVLDELNSWPEVCLSNEWIEIPQAVEKPLQGLHLFRDGKQCRVEPEKCAFICRSIGGLKSHWRRQHGWSAFGPRGGSRTPASLEVPLQKQADAWRPVCCQRLFRVGPYSRYFAVLLEDEPGCNDHGTGPDSIATSVLQNLAILERKQEERGNVVSETLSASEASVMK